MTPQDVKVYTHPYTTAPPRSRWTCGILHVCTHSTCHQGITGLLPQASRGEGRLNLLLPRFLLICSSFGVRPFLRHSTQLQWTSVDFPVNLLILLEPNCCDIRQKMAADVDPWKSKYLAIKQLCEEHQMVKWNECVAMILLIAT